MRETTDADRAVTNVDEYEREKITRTVTDLEMTADALRRYLAYADELSTKGIRIPFDEKLKLESLRAPGQPAGPDTDVLKIQVLAQSALAVAERAAKAAEANVPGIRTAVDDKLKKALLDKLEGSK